MQTFTVKNVTFGEGKPKICVPVTARDLNELTDQTGLLNEVDADLCEWRIDWFEESEKIQTAARLLREQLPDMPLLFTFRTKTEGGEQDISREEYLKICEQLTELPECDLIDIELYTAGENAAALVQKAHLAGKKVVFSNHDFLSTPPEEEIIRRLTQMEELDGDLLKIAVMPNSPADVLTLLSATLKMNGKTSRPLITVSMGDLGAVSRACGEIFGSCVTFGTAGVASAPGQIPVEELRQMLDCFRPHKPHWTLVDAYYIPSDQAEQYIADRELFAEKAAAIFREFYPTVIRDWAGSEDGEAVLALDENDRLMMHVHLDPGNIREMKAAEQNGTLRRWLLADYIKEE